MRGLDYYSHTAFEFIADEEVAQGTVLAGGRYDKLVSEMGGPQAAAVGWAAGIERLELLTDSELLPKSRKRFTIVPILDEEELRTDAAEHIMDVSMKLSQVI